MTRTSIPLALVSVKSSTGWPSGILPNVERVTPAFTGFAGAGAGCPNEMEATGSSNAASRTLGTRRGLLMARFLSGGTGCHRRGRLWYSGHAESSAEDDLAGAPRPPAHGLGADPILALDLFERDAVPRLLTCTRALDQGDEAGVRA